MRKINLIGKKFGRWRVLEEAPSKNGHTMWKCKCECGTIRNVESYALRKGKTKSCGCYRTELVVDRSVKHNMSNSKLYYIYKGMKNRCNNPNVDQYKDYGGRGISVCEEWENDFNKFKKWAYDNGYEEGLTLDRMNNNGNYSPENCRFVTMKEQQNNRRDNIKVNINNQKYRMEELANKTGISIWTLYTRYENGKRGEEIIKPVS